MLVRAGSALHKGKQVAVTGILHLFPGDKAQCGAVDAVAPSAQLLGPVGKYVAQVGAGVGQPQLLGNLWAERKRGRPVVTST